MSKPLSTPRRWLDAGSNPITASFAAAGCAFVVVGLVDAVLSQTDWSVSGNVALFLAVGWALFAGIAMFLYTRRIPR